MSDDIKSLSFEDALREFESVVGKLDGGNVPLEQMITLYERGAALKSHCDAKLKEAEEKIAKITTDGTGAATGTEPLDT